MTKASLTATLGSMVTPKRAARGRRRFRRIDDRLRKRALILDREPDDLRLLDGAVGRFLGGGNDKVADATALDFGGAFHDRQRLGRDARLDAGGADSVLGHQEASLLESIVRVLAEQCKRLVWAPSREDRCHHRMECRAFDRRPPRGRTAMVKCPPAGILLCMGLFFKK